MRRHPGPAGRSKVAVPAVPPVSLTTSVPPSSVGSLLGSGRSSVPAAGLPVNLNVVAVLTTVIRPLTRSSGSSLARTVEARISAINVTTDVIVMPPASTLAPARRPSIGVRQRADGAPYLAWARRLRYSRPHGLRTTDQRPRPHPGTGHRADRRGGRLQDHLLPGPPGPRGAGAAGAGIPRLRPDDPGGGRRHR